MFGGTKFRRACRDTSGAPLTLRGAIAKICLYSGSGVVDDKSLWRGGSASETDQAIFASAKYLYTQDFRTFVTNDDADAAERIINAPLPTGFYEDRVKVSVKGAAGVMMTNFITHTGANEPETRGRFGLSLQRYLPPDRGVIDLAEELQELSSNSRSARPDLIADMKTKISASATQVTIVPGVIESVANFFRLDIAGTAPWSPKTGS